MAQGHNIEELMQYIARQLAGDPNLDFTDVRIYENSVKIKLEGLDWIPLRAGDGATPMTKEFVMKNDTCSDATGKLETRPSEGPCGLIELSKGWLTGKGRLCGDISFKTDIKIPDAFDMPGCKEPRLIVELDRSEHKVLDPNKVASTLDVPVPSGGSVTSHVTTESFSFEGEFTATARMGFKMKIGKTDYTHSDLRELNLPGPFSLAHSKICWDVGGTVKVKFDHKVVLKVN